MSTKNKISGETKVKIATDAFLPTAEKYETAEGSCGKCKDAALDFERLARAMDIKCYTMQVEAFKGDPKGIFLNKPKRSVRGMQQMGRGMRDSEDFGSMGMGMGGMAQQIPAKDFVHNINVIKDGEQLLFVDWTARQFDDKADFPLVMTKEQMMKLWEKSNEEQILAIAMD